MKKLILLSATFLILCLLTIGCSSKPEDIKLSDLKSACDYLSAIEKCMDAAISLGGERDRKDLSEEEKDYMQILEKKAKEIEKAGGKKYTKAEVEECEDYAKIREKFKQVDKYW